MKILIYKRTHKGDPDERGIFGNQDCMGKVRNWNYDAVIGIGGKSPWKGDEDISYKVNWVGLEPKKILVPGKRGDCVSFSHFELYEEKGKNIEENPALFEYMYDSRKRFDMSSSLPEPVWLEVDQILNSVRDLPPSKGYAVKSTEGSDINESIYSAKCKSSYNGEDIEVDISEEC